MAKKNSKKKGRQTTKFRAEKEADAFSLPIRSALLKLKVEDDNAVSNGIAPAAPTPPDPGPSVPFEGVERIDMTPGEEDRVIAEMPVYFNVPKYPIIILQFPTRQRGQTFSTKHCQKPTRLRIKPISGFVEVEVPVPTYKNQRPDISKNYGVVQALLKKYPNDLSCGLSGGFTSASDTKDKRTLGNLPHAEIHKVLREIEAARDTQFDTMIYSGRIYPPDPDKPINCIGVVKDGALHTSPVFAFVTLSPTQNHLDLFRELEDVKQYSEARKDTYEEEYDSNEEDSNNDSSNGIKTDEDGEGDGDAGSNVDSDSGTSTHKNIYDDDTYEGPTHDADYPATDYADTDDDEKTKAEYAAARLPQRQSAASEAKPINMSVKSADEKKDERTAIEKRLDEIKAEKWIECEWYNEDDPEAKKHASENLFLAEEYRSVSLESVLTQDEYLDILSAPRYDATAGKYKSYYKHGTGGSDFSDLSSDGSDGMVSTGIADGAGESDESDESEH